IKSIQEIVHHSLPQIQVKKTPPRRRTMENAKNTTPNLQSHDSTSSTATPPSTSDEKSQSKLPSNRSNHKNSRELLKNTQEPSRMHSWRRRRLGERFSA